MKKLVEINLPSTKLYIKETNTIDFEVRVDLMVNDSEYNYTTSTCQDLLTSLVTLVEFYRLITKHSLPEDKLFVDNECPLSDTKILSLINEGRD